METKSPYFSPKKTRNFTRKHGSTLLQKITNSSKVALEQKEPYSNKTSKANPSTTHSTKNTSTAPSTKSVKGNKKNIRCDAVAVNEICEPQQSNENTPTKKDPPREKTPPEIGIKMEKLESQNIGLEEDSSTVEIKIKVEPADEYQELNEKTPCKQETSDSRSSIKRELNDDSLDGHPSKAVKWEPKNWRQLIENIRQMRQAIVAPVDTMGCDQFTSDAETVIPDRHKRYHCLVSLILSSQTRDQANHECMVRLKKHGLTPETIVSTDDVVLEKLIYPISFYRNKTKFIKQMSQILIDQYDGDIPNNIKELLKLPGVGKKMAHLCMRSAWNVVTGIGVDTHVHRISNWLQLIPEETKQPEATRIALEKWLPFEIWDEFNHLLVGFGQTICTPNFPRCNDCLNAPICPARGMRPIRKTPMKKAIKPEKIEF